MNIMSILNILNTSRKIGGLKMNEVKENKLHSNQQTKTITDITAEVIKQNNLENIEVIYTETKATISGNKDGFHYTLNIESRDKGFIQYQSRFQKDMDLDSIIKEARNLSKKGLTQVQIARILNKSQSYISKILKK